MRYLVITLTALGLIALGGFLITSYGKARYYEGVKTCESKQSKANENEHKTRNILRQKTRKKYASIDNVYCELLAHGELRESDCK
jgi:hypothetical protein